MEKDVKVYVQRDYCRDGLIVGIKMKQNGKWLYAQPIELIFKEKDQYELMEPTFRISGDYADDFIEAFRLALDGKTLDHFKGELDATKKHLEDMRHMVFEEQYKKIEE
jgi:tricorn protease-like protein